MPLLENFSMASLVTQRGHRTGPCFFRLDESRRTEQPFMSSSDKSNFPIDLKNVIVYLKNMANDGILLSLYLGLLLF